MDKLSFAIEIEDDWPPTSSESVWCEVIDTNYRLVNIPFFIKGLAYGDVFQAELDPINSHVFEFKLIKKSGHSVIWMMNNVNLDILAFEKDITEVGCRIECFEKFSLFSIDLPPSVDIKAFDKLISTYEAKGLNFAYPTWRHDD